MVNTTKSISGDPPRGTREPISAGTAAEAHTINTSAVVEANMQYLDEGPPEVVSTTPALNWCAVVGGENVPLVLFATLEDGRTYGVALGSDGRVDNVNDSVEDRDGFQGYQKENN